MKILLGFCRGSQGDVNFQVNLQNDAITAAQYSKCCSRTNKDVDTETHLGKITVTDVLLNNERQTEKSL